MMTNVGVIDRALRLAIAFALLGWSGGHFGPTPPWLLGWAVTVLGAYPLITGLLRWCPIFAFAEISTCAEEG
jgi:Protein of unknown function (DUF2892)